MKEMGFITGSTTHINYESFGYRAVAHILINVDSQQESQLIGFLQKMPEVYSFYNREVKGNLDVIIILKTLEQLNNIKDRIKRQFSILEMKTAIWTDVKEMNYNLSIVTDNAKKEQETVICQLNSRRRSSPQMMIMDDIDQKIADKLSEDGRVSMKTLGREMGISSDAARRSYEKMKKNGVLKVTIQFNPNKIGYRAMCVFFAATSHENSFAIIEKISRIPDVISIMKTTGDYDLQIWAMVKDISQFLSIQEELGKIPGIIRMDKEIWRLDSWEKWPSPRQYISTF